MAFVKLTGTNGRPMLLKYELIESVKEYAAVSLYSWGNKVEVEEYATEILLTNGHEYTVKESVEEVEKILGGIDENSND